MTSTIEKTIQTLKDSITTIETQCDVGLITPAERDNIIKRFEKEIKTVNETCKKNNCL